MKPLIWASICSLPIALIKGYQTLCLKTLFDLALSAETAKEDIIQSCLLLIGLQVLQYPFRVYNSWTVKSIVEKVASNLRVMLSSKIQKIGLKDLSSRSLGDFYSVVINDTAIFSNSMRHLVTIVKEPLTAIVILSVAIYHDWYLAVFIFLCIPFFGIILKYTGQRIKKHTKSAQVKMSEMAQSVTEIIFNHKVLKTYQVSEFFEKKFVDSQKDYFESQKKAIVYEEHSHPSVELVGTIAVCCILIFAHERISDGHLTSGSFISFCVALALFMDPIKKISKANAELNQAFAAHDRIQDLLSIEDERNGSISFKSLKESIEFKNVSFSYDDKKVLDSINLKILKGQKVAFVGGSGSGKSTLIKLLLSLYEVQSGSIEIDGDNLENINRESLYNNFSYVGQDNFILDDSTLENISLGKKLEEKVVKKAMDEAYFDLFSTKELKSESLGTRGSRLSGGQAQRLNLARAILKNGDIFIFDEATSALDNALEDKVKKNIEKLTAGKTVITIAHRLSTVLDYDNIFVMNEGKIVESGNHKQLCDNKGLYWSFYKLSQS